MDVGHFTRLAARRIEALEARIEKLEQIIEVMFTGTPCPRCKGKGFRLFQDEVEDSPGHFIDIDIKRACKACDGKGRVAS